MASSSQTVNVYQRVGPVLRDLPGFSEMILCLFLLANPPIIFHFFWKTCWKIILVDSPWWKNPIRKSPDLEQIQFFWWFFDWAEPSLRTGCDARTGHGLCPRVRDACDGMLKSGNEKRGETLVITHWMGVYPLANKHSYGKSQFSMGKSTINGNFL